LASTGWPATRLGGLGFAPYLERPLSTFEVKRGPIYGEAVHLLINGILGEFQEEIQQVFQTQLVLRKSTRDRGTV
jgi:DNA-binding LacI/PurR family transcriptional regulator